jgi:thiamine pyrophosphokinase
MSRFVILLGGDAVCTARLRSQIGGARVIAADSGMRHAATLGLTPELWLGDFDSAGSELLVSYRHIPRQDYPDGEIAVDEALRRGATEIILLGAFGGQMDHALAHLAMLVGLTRRGIAALATSGREEAYGLVSRLSLEGLASGTRLSILPFSDIEGLTISGVKWPLNERDVPLGATLTLSNVVVSGVQVSLRRGEAAVITYPAGEL